VCSLVPSSHARLMVSAVLVAAGGDGQRRRQRGPRTARVATVRLPVTMASWVPCWSERRSDAEGNQRHRRRGRENQREARGEVPDSERHLPIQLLPGCAAPAAGRHR
jgi:hypothetical protein